ncbi:hypothetical protein [Natrialbaceae archaeon AArc-T1-2]|uniref:hypothetical protein n=1 Tax=Natrialbaceae archaeon AArc-T1-2 TaxID=3053904 RepID=UPI00255B19F4|nr:hypothetical protein [Natrialbaceae archaeon AArc-T1-2]WIV66323.1 hypothetical protein QQ977_11550 [Natrialbaceae archaeon AArc-T1-2]
MTNSTTDETTGDGALEVGPSADELFGDIENPYPSTERVDGLGSGGTGTSTDRTGGVTDRTANEVFSRLRDESDSRRDPDAVLEGESPAEIMNRTDDGPVVTEIDDALTDDDGVEALLLTGRRKADGFLWVECEDDDLERANDADDADSGEATSGEAEPPSKAEADESNDTDSVTSRLRSTLDSLL